MTPIDPDSGGVWVSTGVIYEKLLSLETKVDELSISWREHRLPDRVRNLEIRSWGIPASMITAVIGLVAVFVK